MTCRRNKIDILSLTIRYGLWHISNKIFCYLDALSLLRCEEVCLLWNHYIESERMWHKAMQRQILRYPKSAIQNGWNSFLNDNSNDNPEPIQFTYWKSTSLIPLWYNACTRFKLSRNKLNENCHNIRSNSNSIVWTFTSNGQAVSVYNKGKGYILQIRDECDFKLRYSRQVTWGTSRKDLLCLHATDNRVVVGGFWSQKVWILNIKKSSVLSKGRLFDGLVSYLTRSRNVTISTFIYKYVNAGTGVNQVKLHQDGKRLAVLMPMNLTAEIWDIDRVARLQSYSIPSDASYLLWENDLMLIAPIFSGVIEVFDTYEEKALNSIKGNIRCIDAIASYGQLCSTGEARSVRLWNLRTGENLVSYVATKHVVTSLYLNDTFLFSGSSSGVVKIWDLKTLLDRKCWITPLRKISMKGLLQYSIKTIYQYSYLELVVVAKHESKNGRDKIKFLQVDWPKQEMLEFFNIVDSIEMLNPHHFKKNSLR